MNNLMKDATYEMIWAPTEKVAQEQGAKALAQEQAAGRTRSTLEIERLPRSGPRGWRWAAYIRRIERI